MAADALLDPNLPPEIAAEQASLARRRRLADAMLQRSMQPIQSANPRSPVSWTQGLAQIVNAYMGAKGGAEVDKGQAALGQRYQQGLAAEVDRVARMKQGTPGAVPDSGMAFEEAGAVPADPRGAVQAALTSQYPMVRKMGELDYAHMKKADEPFTLQPGAARYGPDGKLIASELPKAPIEKSFKAGDIRKFMDGGMEVTQEYQADGTWKELARGGKKEGGGVTVQAPVTPVTIQDPKDPNKTIIVDGRSGKKIGDGPKLSETGKSNAKRQIAMQGVGDTIQQARDILTGKGGAELPTGSGVGNLVDAAGALVGYTPKGAKAADQLKVAGGALVSKIPRFEGPQSDKDVAYYKEVAGRVGDASLPRDRRLAALDEVERIWGEFEAGKKYGFFAVSAPGAQPPVSPAAAPGGLSQAEQAELDALRKKHGRSAR